MFILKGELPDKYKDRFQGDFTTNANIKLTDLLPTKGKDNE
jgi:ribosomal protein S17E